MASSGLYSSLYITVYSPNQLSLYTGHNSQNTEHMRQITCYEFIYFGYSLLQLIHTYITHPKTKQQVHYGTILSLKRDSIHWSRSDTYYEAGALPPSHNGWMNTKKLIVQGMHFKTQKVILHISNRQPFQHSFDMVFCQA